MPRAGKEARARRRAKQPYQWRRGQGRPLLEKCWSSCGSPEEEQHTLTSRRRRAEAANRKDKAVNNRPGTPRRRTVWSRQAPPARKRTIPARTSLKAFRVSWMDWACSPKTRWRSAAWTGSQGAAHAEPQVDSMNDRPWYSLPSTSKKKKSTYPRKNHTRQNL